MTVLQLVGDVRDLEFVGRHGARLSSPPIGRVRHAFLRDGARVVDEVLLVGTSAGTELHLHGGDALLNEVACALNRCGFEPDGGEPCPVPVDSLRHARALLSNREGPLAALVARLVQQPEPRDWPDGVSACVVRALGLAGLAERLVRPAVVRIVGRPNAGKSTLFNAWLGHERALVSPHPGTTRDTVRATVLLRGVPTVLEDTEGARPQETNGDGADLLVHLLSGVDEAGSVILPEVPVIEVLGRADERSEPPVMRAVSGRTGAGLDALLDSVSEALEISADPSDDAWAPVDGTLARALRSAARSLAESV